MLITSAVGGEGKTTTCIGLAQGLRRLGEVFTGEGLVEWAPLGGESGS